MLTTCLPEHTSEAIPQLNGGEASRFTSWTFFFFVSGECKVGHGESQLGGRGVHPVPRHQPERHGRQGPRPARLGVEPHLSRGSANPADGRLDVGSSARAGMNSQGDGRLEPSQSDTETKGLALWSEGWLP